MGERRTGGHGAEPEGVEQNTIEPAIEDYLPANGGSTEDGITHTSLGEMKTTDPLAREKITSILCDMVGEGRIVCGHEQDAYRFA